MAEANCARKRSDCSVFDGGVLRGGDGGLGGGGPRDSAGVHGDAGVWDDGCVSVGAVLARMLRHGGRTALCVLAGIAVGVVFALTVIGLRWTASCQVYVAPVAAQEGAQAAAGGAAVDESALLPLVSDLVKGPAGSAHVVEQLGGAVSPGDVGRMVTLTQSGSSPFVVITVTGREEQEVRAVRDAVLTTLFDLYDEYSGPDAGMRVLARGTDVVHAVPPRTVEAAIIGACAGLLVAAGVALAGEVRARGAR